MRYRDFFFPLKHSYNVISGIQALPACHLWKGGEVNQLSLHYGQEPWQAVAVDHPADARGCWGSLDVAHGTSIFHIRFPARQYLHTFQVDTRSFLNVA